jgi:hypothetical protein
VRLPAGIGEPFEVFVNGVPQRIGDDYEIRDRELIFKRALVQEGRIGLWRWFLGAWGIGTYRRNDEVDVRYQRDGRPAVAQGLPLIEE